MHIDYQKFTRQHIFSFLFITIIVLASFLRLYKLSSLPPAPYWDETSLGVDAYSILKTGKDHHGHAWPIVAFESYGDWKPSLYFYVLVPFIYIFDLTVLAIRLPAAISGIFIVIGVGVLAKNFVIENKQIVQLLAMLITTISPWAIIFSRAGWEANLATALILWGVIFFISSRERWLISAFLLALSMYAYHAARIIAPLLGLILVILETFKTRKIDKKNIFTGLLALVILLPLIFSFRQSTTQIRFAQTSIFTDLSVIEKSNALVQNAGSSIFAKIIYHRYLLFGKEILSNFLSHFTLDFLFISGDVNPRHSIQFMGQLYHLELLFLLLGFYYLIKNFDSKKLLLLFWLLIGILPAALTKSTPHALRILPTLPVWMLLIVFGLMQCHQDLKNWLLKIKLKSSVVKKIIKQHTTTIIVVMIAFVYMLELLMFWRFYSTIYPVLYSSEWQYGYQQLIGVINQSMKVYPNALVYISRDQGRPAMYNWFYSKTDPVQIQLAAQSTPKDQGEFLEYQNINFYRGQPDLKSDEAIIAASSLQFYQEQYAQVTLLAEIKNLKNELIWTIIYLKRN